VQLGFRQKPLEQTRWDWQLALEPQVPLQEFGWTIVGVRVAMGVEVGVLEGVEVAVMATGTVGVGGIGVGVGVETGGTSVGVMVSSGCVGVGGI